MCTGRCRIVAALHKLVCRDDAGDEREQEEECTDTVQPKCIADLLLQNQKVTIMLCVCGYWFVPPSRPVGSNERASPSPLHNNNSSSSLSPQRPSIRDVLPLSTLQ